MEVRYLNPSSNSSHVKASMGRTRRPHCSQWACQCLSHSHPLVCECVQERKVLFSTLRQKESVTKVQYIYRKKIQSKVICPFTHPVLTQYQPLVTFCCCNLYHYLHSTKRYKVVQTPTEFGTKLKEKL